MNTIRPHANPKIEVTKKEFSAGIIIFRRTKEGPKFLSLYHGGPYWNFPKGRLEGETNFKAALREVDEETGIKQGELHFKSWFKVQDRFTYVRNRENCEGGNVLSCGNASERSENKNSARYARRGTA